MPETAFSASLAIDRDRARALQSASLIFHLLRDFIHEDRSRDALDTLYEAFVKGGMELTSKAMRKEYEAWKSTQMHLGIMPITES